MPGADVYDLIGLYFIEALFGTRWGWVVALILIAGFAAAIIVLFLPAQPDVSGTPEEVVARWNEQVQWLAATNDLESVRAEFVQHVLELRQARDRGDRGEEKRARKRIAEDFKDLWALRKQQGLDR